MVPNADDAAALVWACFKLPCTLRANASHRHTVDTWAAGANVTDLRPDVVVSAGEALRSGTAVGEEISPSWPRGCTADAPDAPLVVTADIAAAAVAAMGAAGVATQDASVADHPVAGCDLDHCRGGWLSVGRGGLAHWFHLQSRFGRCPHGQWLLIG